MFYFGSLVFFFFFFKQKTAYEMRISDWSSDVCSSDLGSKGRLLCAVALELDLRGPSAAAESADKTRRACPVLDTGAPHMDVRRFPRRRGVLSLRQVSLHKQRKVARAVPAEKILLLAEQWAHQDRPKSEERRCGKELVRTCEIRGAA